MRIPWLWLIAATSVAQAAPQPPTFRLGDTATPIEYSVTLAIDPREAKFSGEVRIAMRVNRAAPVLWLNATNLTIDAADPKSGTAEFKATAVQVEKLPAAIAAAGE